MKLRVLIAGVLLTMLVSCQTGENSRNINNKKVKNIILLIGDGMGVNQIYSAMSPFTDSLNIERVSHIGFSKTYASNKYVTDSGAGGTAIAIGKKTYNGAIGVDEDTISSMTIIEFAEKNGLSSGLVSTSGITHATPASFVAHQKSRNLYENIAVDFLNAELDVIIGGGRNHFNKRKDSVNLLLGFEKKGFKVLENISDIAVVDSGKLICLTHEEHPPSMLEGRGNMLVKATKTAINILDNNTKGFFLMVEGSQIDWEAHSNNTEGIVAEMIDFDIAIGLALDFAMADGNTLVIVTADHETGGMTLNGIDKTGKLMARYTTTGHTGVMVPVFAYGPGAEEFTGIYENTAIFYKMMKLYGFSIQ